jgi:outer membrane immunogenic protein
MEVPCAAQTAVLEPEGAVRAGKKSQQIISFPPAHFVGECGFWETALPSESSIVRPQIGSLGAVLLALKALLGTNGSGRNAGDLGMKKVVLLGIVGLVALAAAPANAADLAARPYTKAPAMVAAIYDWSGFYVGLNGGGGSARKCWDLVQSGVTVFAPPLPEGCHSATGGTVGGQIGYRWQSANWVFGIEAQGNWANFKGSNLNLLAGGGVIAAGVTDQSKVNSFGLLTGQVGYAWNNVLWYVKGGGAAVGDKYSTFVVPGLVVDSVSDTRFGAAVGTGLEVGFAPNWSVAVEYDHLFLGTRTVQAATPAGAFSATDRIKQDVDLGTVRVNYRWGGPVIAKY